MGTMVVVFSAVYLGSNIAKGGTCGACLAGYACVTGLCVVATTPGSCKNPIEFFPNGFVIYLNFTVCSAFQLGIHTRNGDTSEGVNEVAPTCNYLSQGDFVTFY